MTLKQLNELTGKFLANKQIKLVCVSDKKTVLGNELLKVEYEGGGSDLLPTAIVERMATQEIQNDLTKYQADYCLPVIEQITTILLENGVKMFDVGYILQTVDNSLSVRYSEAVDKLFGNKGSMARTIIDVDEVLKNCTDNEKVV